jgi:hypothetical protein
VKRVLFVGDGKHDIGGPDGSSDEPFSARGVVPNLAARVAAIDVQRSVALRWLDLSRFSPTGKRGYAAKIKAAQLLAERRWSLDGSVCVVDEDNDPSRHQLSGVQGSKECPVVFGVAVRSIEAWTLGAPTALAGVLGTSPEKVRHVCPSARVEELYEGSGKPELRSKQLLRKLAMDLGRRDDSLELREEVAKCTDPDELCRTCSQGFAPFAAALREVFGAVG